VPDDTDRATEIEASFQLDAFAKIKDERVRLAVLRIVESEAGSSG
jgi:hypothetical protein